MVLRRALALHCKLHVAGSRKEDSCIAPRARLGALDMHDIHGSLRPTFARIAVGRTATDMLILANSFARMATTAVAPRLPLKQAAMNARICRRIEEEGRAS